MTTLAVCRLKDEHKRARKMEQNDFSPDEDADEYDEAIGEDGGASEVSDAQPEEQVSAAQSVAQLERRCFADRRTRDMGAEEYGRFSSARERSRSEGPKFRRWVEITTGVTCTGSKERREVRMRLPPSCAPI